MSHHSEKKLAPVVGILPLIQPDDELYAQEKLTDLYQNDLIPAEKKSYLSQHHSSVGPYLGVETRDPNTPHFLLDASSQIATLGLGFNSSVMMGTTQFLESWLNDANGEDFRNLVKAFERFLKRKLDWENVHLNFCHSGAEANEIALGHCFRKRKNLDAKKVICFEGSFHGRMLVSLFASWNKSKREPFQWPGFEAHYIPFPEIKDLSGNFDQLNFSFPEKWTETWDNSSRSNFKLPTNWNEQEDPVLSLEINSLLKLRESLIEDQSFAIIIEPMQCEGGDKYASNRFFSALLLIARSFDIPVIFDEVQTGYHLGEKFFWHKQLELKGLKLKNLKPGASPLSNNREILTPNYITCAKKAQIGLVISPQKETTNKLHEAEFQVSSVIRGYLHALALDQLRPKIIDIKDYAKNRLNALTRKYFDLIEYPRINGLAFAFDLKDPKKLAQIINKRFAHGLLYYPAGEKTLRFRLNTAYSKRDIDFLFNQLESILLEVYRVEKAQLPVEVKTQVRYPEEIVSWQKRVLKLKWMHWSQNKINAKQVKSEVINFFKTELDLELTVIDESNFDDYRDLIQELQERNYEPARQTSLSTFERTAKAQKGLCLGVKKNKELLGIVFSAPLSVNPLDRGIRQDPYFGNDDVLYMVDTTIDKKLQGRGLGRTLKYALTVLAQVEGRLRIQGRNRDRLAASMLNINLSLGGYEQNYIRDDYQDFEDYRDVYYYTSPLTWSHAPINLSSSLRTCIGEEHLDPEFIDKNFFLLTNKICLSNFISNQYLENIQKVFDLIHPDLRHGYTASGQSECVDKVAKAIYYKQGQQKKIHMLTFDKHFFGQGSFLSRSLSFAGSEEEYFPVHSLECPNENNYLDVLNLTEEVLKKEKIMAVWIEPIRQIDMVKTPTDFLVALKKLCHKYQVKLVFNETAAGFYRFNDQYFYPNNDSQITPDAGFSYLGGQSGICYFKKECFVDGPLMMISTWDGDEYSMSAFIHGAYSVVEAKEDYLKTRKSFEKKLYEVLAPYKNLEIHLDSGVGNLKGALPKKISVLFEKINYHFRIVPTWSEMKRFIQLR